MLKIHLKCINYLNIEREIALKVIVKEKYPDMPMPEKSSGWGYKFVRFKEEKRQINIQLGQEGGKGLEIFNQNLKKYEFIKENK